SRHRFLGTPHVFRSTNGGANWRPFSEALLTVAIPTLAVDPSGRKALRGHVRRRQLRPQNHRLTRRIDFARRRCRTGWTCIIEFTIALAGAAADRLGSGTSRAAVYCARRQPLEHLRELEREEELRGGAGSQGLQRLEILERHR